MGYMWIVSVYTDGHLTRRYTAMLHSEQEIVWHVQHYYKGLELEYKETNKFCFSNSDVSLSVIYQN